MQISEGCARIGVDTAKIKVDGLYAGSFNTCRTLEDELLAALVRSTIDRPGNDPRLDLEADIYSLEPKFTEALILCHHSIRSLTRASKAMNPLTLPEVRMLVGQFLATREILACILVCRAWYRDYQALLYRSIRLDETTMRLLPRGTLRKHAPLIRHLVLMEPMRFTLAAIAPWADAHGLTLPCNPTFSAKRFIQHSVSLGPDSPCSNLLTLDIQPSIMFRKRIHEQVPKHQVLTVGTDQYDIENNDFWCLQSTDACILLIQLNPWLHNLTESWDDMSPFHRIRFTSQLIRLRHNLVNLHLSKWEVTPEECNMLLENSPKLEILRFSKLTIKKNTGMAIGLRVKEQVEAQHQHLYHHSSLGDTTPTMSQASSTVDVINFRQLKALAITHASIQLEELYLEAPELLTACISFSQVNFKRPHPYSYTSPNPNQSYQGHHHYYHQQQHPRIYWNTPRLVKLICNRTENNVATASLYKTPIALRSLSFADYEIESRLVTEIITAQGLQLESIRLACFSGISGRDVRLILTRCPNLVTFHAPEIMMWAGDLVPVANDNRNNGALDTATLAVGDTEETGQEHSIAEEWVCRKLERLSLYMCLESNTTDDYSGPQQECSYQNHYFVGAESSSCGSTMKPATLDIGMHQQQQQQQQQKQQQQQEWQCHHLQPNPKGRQQQQQQQQQPSPQQEHQQSQQQAKRRVSNIRVRNAFRDQLAKLTRLRHLDLSGEHVTNVDHVQIGLPLTIDSGIQSLATLKDLEHVTVTGWIDDMSIQEIEWMKHSWPKLNRISLLKTNSAGRHRFQSLLAQTWPEVVVQDKDRKNAYCAPLYFYC
ncbi:hypothetical protein BGZ65_004126 [Modicella reniformis]|uniref:F-box domain-containing protein n=1 Tax=Modicella reniformis TaxID=1440133 RepID=A0A9P6IKT2_9FUNG|nr:hypothetical protein BGZ65_004126 [Modicella reniformis]